MKMNFIKCVAFVFCVTILFPSQLTAENDSRATWFGIDFSRARMIGSYGFNDTTKIKTYYFNRWNGLVIEEFYEDIKKY